MQRYLIAAIIAIIGLVGVSLGIKKPSQQVPHATQAVVVSDCATSSTRPCYERQTGKKTIDLVAQGGENAFTACLQNNSLRQAGQMVVKTAACQEEIMQYCYEGKSDVLLRKFDGTCKAAVCPALPFVKFASAVEPGWNDPATNIGLRTIFRSKSGALYIGGFQGTTLSTPLLGKIYRSADNGQSWTGVALPQHNDTYGTFVRRIIEDASGALYASGYRLWKSTDRGATWAIISQSIADISSGEVVDDALVSKDGSLLALVRVGSSSGGAYNEVHKSLDGGTTWQQIAGPLFQSYAGYNFMEAGDGGLLFTTHGGDIYRYANGTLSQTAALGVYGSNTAFLKAKDGTLYFVGGDPATPSEAVVAYRSSDNGQTWAKGVELPFSRFVAEDAPIEASDDSLWAAAWTSCGDTAVYKSIDRGATWNPIAASPTSQYANIIDYNSLHGPFMSDIVEDAGGRILTVPYEFAALFAVPK